jgi:hypothetical protein
LCPQKKKDLTAGRWLQEDVLRACLERFYSRAEGDREGIEVYSRSKEQHRMLLLHLLIVALVAEDFEMGSRVFEALRAALKLAPQEMATCYRYALRKCSSIRPPLKRTGAARFGQTWMKK